MISARRLARLTSIEVYKLFRQRMTLAVVGVPTVVAALVPQGLWLSSRQGMQGYLAFSSALELSLLLGSLLILLHSSVSVAWDRSEKTLRNTLAAPVRRSEVLLSRWLVLELEVLCLLGLVVGAALLSTALHYSFEDIRGEAIEPLFYASELRHHTAIAIAYHVPAAVALVSLGLLASVLSTSPAVSAALGLSLLLGLDITKSVFSSARGVVQSLFNSYLPSLFDQTSYLHGVTAMANGIGDVLWADDSPLHWLVLAVPAAYTAAALAASLVLFSRRGFAE
jgi:ABC-type transport system involved in multi-copper enzyme maturation permease subunit